MVTGSTSRRMLTLPLLTLLGVALGAMAFLLGGVLTFFTMKSSHVACVRWPDTNPPEYNCDNMAYVFPFFLGGFLLAVLVVLFYVFLVLRSRVVGPRKSG
ncbi:hypothetical protein GCM10022402_37070 [Salinactinospora qingdaonensis]|uniref:Uncharacterized protein n=1 Tax=Salinactinospora qingdaonensis TaxID=702744 RepID=A0ABP7G4I2_9ACTN